MKLPLIFSPSRSAIVAASILAVNVFLPPLPSSAIWPFQQYDTAYDIPSKAFDQNAVLYGRVERVLDGDTIRIRHYPLFPLVQNSSYDSSKKNIADHTISVRLYGIDTPELGKYGNPGMPLADEAKEFTKSLVGDKVVRVKMLRRDRYSRVVGKVTTSGRIPLTQTDVSVELARKGLASLYKGAGAEYDDSYDLLQRAIGEAQRNKRGIWSKGIKQMVDPSDYKRAVRNGR